MENDLTPVRLLGLVLMAVLMWGALILNSFYSDDSPVQVRADCAASFSHCSQHLVWVGFR